MKKFKVTVNGETYEVLVEEIGEGNAPAVAPAPKVVDNPAPAAVHNPAPAPVKNNPAPAAAPAAKPAAPAPANGGAGVVRAPMPGNILRLPVAEGSAVKRGQTVLVLEAMKMENEIMAAKDGVVRQIYVATGQSVNTGDPMFNLE